MSTVCRHCGEEIELADNPVTGLIDTWRDVTIGDPNCFENEIEVLPFKVGGHATVVTGLHEPL
jgi:hypothetical protein